MNTTDSQPSARPSPSQAEADVQLLSRVMAWTLRPIGADDLPAQSAASSAASLERADRRFPAKTFRDLQWAQLIEGLVGGAVTPEGVQLIEDLQPLPDVEAVEWRLKEVAECMELLESDDAPPLRGLRDIRRAIAYVMREGVLDAEDLEAIGRNCDVAARCERYMTSRSTRLPHLAIVAGELDPCKELRSTLTHAIEPGGRLSDHASPDLGRLRRTVQNQHDRLKARVDSMLKGRELEEYLQDDYYTVREDRYVLPIRVGGKGAVPGIVHGYSSSGQTAYIEPADLVELNNQLRWSQIELQEEEHRILMRLSGMVAQYAPALRRNIEVLAYLDVVTAFASYGRRIKATIPAISTDELDLKQARHPLLYLKMAREVDGQMFNDTVPNDIPMEFDKRVLIVSGPNTGGKTVSLKTVGLCALMVRCGLPLPVDEGSKIPLFGSIYTDIGDEQSIERDLSTFSGHIVNINTFLERIDRESLVLLDELFTGTDPMQGAALAVALLEELAARGTTTVVTTHLEGLKTLAYQSDVFKNASMGFDVQSLSPTYRMTMGVPGSSFAVRIAARLGLPDKLIARAGQVLEGQEHHTIEEIMASLEDQMASLRKEQNRLEQSRREADKAQRRFKDKYAAIVSKEREMVFAETKKLREQLREAREQIRAMLKELKQASVAERGDYTQQQLQRMQDKLKGIEDTVEHATDRTRPVAAGPKGLVAVRPDELEVGMHVYVQAFKREGVVIVYEIGDEQARVQLGDLKVNVDVDKLYFSSDERRRSHVRGHVRDHVRDKTDSGVSNGEVGNGEVATALGAPMLLPQTTDNTVDLRGLRADDALEKLDLFLDSAFLRNIDGVYIIHGHGTGALKRAVRDYLPDSPYIREFRRGGREEGGDGVTIAYLKTGG